MVIVTVLIGARTVSVLVVVHLPVAILAQERPRHLPELLLLPARPRLASLVAEIVVIRSELFEQYA